MKHPNIIIPGLVLACLALTPAAYSAGGAAISATTKMKVPAFALANNPDLARINSLTTVESLKVESLNTVNRLTDEKAAIEKQRNDIAAANKELEQKRAALLKVQEGLNAQIAALKTDQARLAEANKALEARSKELSAAKSALENENAALEAKKAELAGAVSRLTAEQGTLGVDNNRLRAEKAGLENEKVALQNETTGLRNEKKQLESDKAALVKDLDWSSLLVKIFSGSTITAVLAILGFIASQRTTKLQNRRLEIENAALEEKLKAG